MWTPLRKEIEAIRKDQGLVESDFHPVGIREWPSIMQKIYHRFCGHMPGASAPLWLWEHFVLDTFSIPSVKKPYFYLDTLVDPQECIWFFVNETVNEKNNYWFYEGKIKPIQTVLAEACYIDEVFLVSKKYPWMICINHHNHLITTGEGMPDKLRALGQQDNQGMDS
jgi:hypothetical protein